MPAFTSRGSMRRRRQAALVRAKAPEAYATSAPDGPTGSPPPKGNQLSSLVAPAPIVDRWPIVIGQGLSLSYLSSVYRLCTTGIRYQFVDALNELFEHDPHARGVTRQRIIQVAGARIEFHPAELPPGDPDEELAREIAEEVNRQVKKIPSLTQAIGALAWGITYGVSGAEKEWSNEYVPVRGRAMWEIRRLRNIHSRRLSYSNPVTWDLHIYDQGPVGPGYSSFGRTTGAYGLRIDDYPGKFVVHTPQLNGDYPTRDGEGRYIGFYMALKRMVIRATSQDFERTIRPWIIGYFSREEKRLDKSAATPEDIKSLDAAVKALGLGALNAATLPDSCKVEILRAASSYSPMEFVAFLDSQMSKAMLGQTFTTEPGKYGAKGTSETGKQGSLEIARYDGACLADTFDRDVAFWITKLNYPGKEHLCPQTRFLVDEEPDPQKLMELAKTGAGIGMPIDADELGQQTGMPLIPQERPDDAPSDWKPKPRRLLPLKPVDPSVIDDTIKPPPTPIPPGAPGAVATQSQPPDEGEPPNGADESAADTGKGS